MSLDVVRVAQLAGDALGHRVAGGHAPRHDDRPAAGQRLDRHEAEALALETRQATSQARNQRGTSLGRHARGDVHAVADPQLGSELPAVLRPAARRPRARARRRPRPCARRRRPPAGARGSWPARGCRRTTTRGPRACQPSAPRAISRSPSTKASRSTPALTMCRRSPSGPVTASRRAPRSSETAKIAQAPATARRGRLAHARRALGVGDVGAVGAQRVRHAGRARGAAGDRPRGHEVVTPDDVGPPRARGRASAPGEAPVLAQRAPASAPLARGREQHVVPGALERSHEAGHVDAVRRPLRRRVGVRDDEDPHRDLLTERHSRAGCRTRTDDIFLTREALYQLS